MSVGRLGSSQTHRQTTNRHTTNHPRKRRAIDELSRERIIEHARSHPNSPNSIVLKWVRENIREDFRQSTLSTILKRAGIRNKRRDGRGRPSADSTSTNDNPANDNPTDDSPTNDNLTTSQVACVTNADLTKPAPKRMRARDGKFPQVDMKILEDSYAIILQGEFQLTWEWVSSHALQLLQTADPGYQKKKLTGFLDQLRNRYLLMSIVFDCIKDFKYSYAHMVRLLGEHFDALKFASGSVQPPTSDSVHISIASQLDDRSTPLPVALSEHNLDFDFYSTPSGDAQISDSGFTDFFQDTSFKPPLVTQDFELQPTLPTNTDQNLSIDNPMWDQYCLDILVHNACSMDLDQAFDDISNYDFSEERSPDASPDMTPYRGTSSSSYSPQSPWDDDTSRRSCPRNFADGTLSWGELSQGYRSFHWS